MRAYFFGNMYLSSIQQGIQAQHCTAEMFYKYRHHDKSRIQHEMLMIWAEKHKTTILLNGGEKEALLDIVRLLKDGIKTTGFDDNPYPWATFSESNDALNCCLTCVGIVIPERVYELAKRLREAKNRWIVISPEGTSSWDVQLCYKINNCGVAR